MYMVVPAGGQMRLFELQIVYCDTVLKALDQASSFLAMGFAETSIQTAEGGMIEGASLAACCAGKMALNEDLSVRPL